MQENGLIRKLSLISKYITVQTGQQMTVIAHVAQYLKK